MSRSIVQSGFSAVELLITLFIAFLFVLMGYQLYSVSIQSGGEERIYATASSNGYYYLNLYKEFAFDLPCGYAIPPTAIDDGKGAIGVSFDCPNASLQDNLRSTTVESYYGVGDQQQKVIHAIYVTK